ncbi:hypothetical protein PTRA_a1545 [Pseudoalteromonas translucida KMM 520]|uniref:Uncharacterized protein n=1 Tax=Pseudoalteromonas translucida KMM 520 TaxID=1315283 RepID=A0A0U2WCC6_9GAMM|nr:hypothetical protein PTRA_a1545 [Pseudoalteromonas translucida KMM 520]
MPAIDFYSFSDVIHNSTPLLQFVAVLNTVAAWLSIPVLAVK